MTQKLRIFVSATTRDLGSYRRAVAEWLRAQGHEPVVQDEFEIQPDFVTISRMLLEQLRDCDGVVCLIGDHYGAEPKDFPDGEARRSYTQLEYELGRTLKRPVYLFFTTPECPRDNPPAAGDPADLQRAYRERLQQRNEIWYSFGSREQLLGQLPKLSFRAAVGRPNNLPFGTLGSLFKGRDEFLERLRHSLTEKPTHAAAVFSRQAIHGLGGVGKTRAAVEYGLRYEAEYTALLFVTADTPSKLTSGLANLCGGLVLNLPERDETNVEKQAAAALRWLERNPGWFLILDNVDTPEAAVAAEKLLARLSAGHTVVTSRLANWGAEVEPLELDVLNEAPATEFLLERTAGKRRATPTDPHEAAALARDLDGLALALEQAGAFVAKHRCSLADYRSRWAAQQAKVVEWHDERAMKYPRSVATTWQTSVDELSADGRGLLNVLCWLAPEPVPLTMLAKLGTPEGVSPIDVELACANLAEYSLVKWTDDSAAVKAHRLVQDVTRYRLPEPERRGWLERALGMVNEFVVGDPDDVRVWMDVYTPSEPHTVTVSWHADAAGITDPTIRLLNRAGRYLCSRAEYSQAEPLLRRALALSEQVYGLEHYAVAHDLTNLAAVLEASNRVADAESLLRRALAIVERAFGTNDSSVALRLNNLGDFLRKHGRYSEANVYLQQALDCIRSSSSSHSEYVTSILGNLALVFLETNRSHEAEPILRELLTTSQGRATGYGPETALRMNNLAELLRETGRHDEAEVLYRHSLDINEKNYGPDHPRVALGLNNLALLLAATQREDEAEVLYRRALAIEETAHGANHPNVARVLNNLGAVLKKTGRELDAIAAYQRALVIERDSLGSNYHNVALVLSNLATLFLSTDQYNDAESVYRQLIDVLKVIHGSSHPLVVTNTVNLAYVLKLSKRYAEAELLYRQSLELAESFEGPNTPQVASVANNLARLLESTNRPAEAEPLFARVVRIFFSFEQQTGREHQHWNTALNNYSEFLNTALGLTRDQAVVRIREVLGLDSPSPPPEEQP